MKMVLRCREIAGEKECDFVATGDTEDEVFKTMGDHFVEVHGLTVATKPVRDVFRRSLRWE